MQKATKKGRDEKIFDFFLEDRLIPMPVTHRLSKTASLWKVHRQNWDRKYNTHWTIKPHDHSPHNRVRVKLPTDELYKLIFLQPREPTEGEKQQMVVRMESELAEFMRKPHESTFPDDTRDKCQKTLGQVLEFLESRYNTVYTQLGRNMNAKRNKSPKAKPKSRFKIGKKRCPPGCVKRKVSRKVSRKRRSAKRKASRKRRSAKRKASRKRRSVKRKVSRKVSRKRRSAKRKVSRKRRSVKRKSRKKVIGGKMRTIHKSKNPIPYEEDWAKGFVTHIGPGGGGGRNNYTGAKKVPTRRILDARKKLIDKVYEIHYQLLAIDSYFVYDMISGKILSPDEWRVPPQFMDRDELKDYVRMATKFLKKERKKYKLKKSHKFSAGKKRVGKRARGKYHKRDKKDKSRRHKRDKKDKSRRRKKDKSRRRKKKTKFSAGNKIPATHEADKKLSKAAKAWRKATMDCFADHGKATMKIKRLEKKLGKCSRNLTLSRELLKASKKKKFRNGDGKHKKKPNLVFKDLKSRELMSKLKAVKKKPVVLYPNTKGWMHHPEGFGGTSSER